MNVAKSGKKLLHNLLDRAQAKIDLEVCNKASQVMLAEFKDQIEFVVFFRVTHFY